MAIKIIDADDVIEMTAAEHERLLREYNSMTHMVDKPSFELWVRGRRASGGRVFGDLPKQTVDFLHAVAPGSWLPK